MKRIILYRLLVIVLVVALFLSSTLYRTRPCIVVKQDEIVNPNYVFLGDSITDFYDLEEYYENMPVVNSGIDGNKTEDILSNMEDRVYKYNPSKVILLIGINDLKANKSEEKVVENIDVILKKIKQNLPNCEIYVESIYPMNEDWSVYVDSETIQSVNKKIKKYASENNYTYIDVYSKLIDEDEKLKKEYSNDGLHPNENGYEVITKIVKKSILK